MLHSNVNYTNCTAEDFILGLDAKNIKLWPEGNLLRYEAPAGAMDGELLKTLKARKDEIIKCFRLGQEPFSENSLPAGTVSKNLRVVMQREITTFLHRSLPMCAFLAYPCLIPWYYSKFIQIYSRIGWSGGIELDYLEPYDFYNEVAENVKLGYNLLNHAPDIVRFIIENINMGHYIIANVDEYYLPSKACYNKVHFVHASFIYGYDNEKGKLKAIGFNHDHMFAKMDFEYNKFRQAFENGKLHYKESASWCAWSCIQLIKPKNLHMDFPFRLDKFAADLKEYIFSIPDSNKFYLSGHYGYETECGARLHDVIISGIERLAEGMEGIDYNAIHLISEHKKCLYDRLVYVMSRYKLSDSFKKLLDEYFEVIERINRVRLSFLLDLSKNSGAGRPPDKEMLNNAAGQIKFIKDWEHVILSQMYEEIHRAAGEEAPAFTYSQCLNSRNTAC